ncbi:MAG TPA: hypothetical protein VGM75_16175, partial [Pseudonocardiaceae bacterium]
AGARRMWVRYETFHDVTYFTPESRAVADELGCKGGWMGYFGMRAAPLGAAGPQQVVSAFYNFHRSLVHRALPDAWAIAAPERFLAARLLGADRSLRRMLGDDVLSGEAMAEAAELAVRVAGFAQIEGRPMAVANAALGFPAEPHLALWQAATLLRESRGDGHVAALVAADLDPVETLVTFGAERGLDPAYLRKARGWPEPEWAAGAARLRERGLLTEEEKLTDAGADLRQWVEDRTDQAAARPWRELGAASTARLAELLTPFARRLAEQNDAMKANPMALDAQSELGH